MPTKIELFNDWRKEFFATYPEATPDQIIEIKKLQYLAEISSTLEFIEETITEDGVRISSGSVLETLTTLT